MKKIILNTIFSFFTNTNVQVKVRVKLIVRGKQGCDVVFFFLLKETVGLRLTSSTHQRAGKRVLSIVANLLHLGDLTRGALLPTAHKWS